MAEQAAIQQQQGPAVGRPPGSVPVGGMEAVLEEEENEARNNPVTKSKQSLVQGRKMYWIYCSPCHGSAGKGDGPVAPYLSEEPADLSDPELHTDTSDGLFFHVISHGTMSEIMPGFTADVRPSERWALVHFVRTLKRSD